MPEGDTLHKIAAVLTPRLEGCRLEKVQIRGAASCPSGQVVRGIRAIGKHLLIELDNGLVLRAHLGMYGSWHRYAPGEPWRKPRSRASIVLETATDVFVCFNARSVDFIEARKLKLHPVVGRLGPDLLSGEVDLDTVIHRARTLTSPHDIVSDLLLDQRIASGIGNVYKCEVLFLNGLHPETPLGRLDDETVRGVYETARELLLKNLDRGMRRTITSKGAGGSRYWVYGRAGKPCLKCGEPIRYRRLGKTFRGTNWCPQCQKIGR